MSFQKSVNTYLPYAVAGDFASANPRASVIAGEQALVAGASGVTIGKFAWVDDDGATVQPYGTATRAPDGFVHREQQGLITTYLAEASMIIPAGFGVTIMSEGDYWAVNAGPGAASIGDQVYADYSNGDVYSGSAPTGASVTASMGATFTASGAGTALTVSAVTGFISIGETLGVTTGISAGTKIIAQVSGTTGGAGVYTTSAATTISAATATSYGNVLNVTAVSSGVLKIGDPVSGTGIPSGAVVASFIAPAAGGIGKYVLDQSATAYAAGTTVTVTAGVSVAGWKVRSTGAVGELIKISTWGN